MISTDDECHVTDYKLVANDLALNMPNVCNDCVLLEFETILVSRNFNN
jgi:hypothetical protein